MCQSVGEPSPSSSTSNEPSSQRSPSTGADAKEKERRVPLACLRCRAKRARCSGSRPRCKACETADVECQWYVAYFAMLTSFVDSWTISIGQKGEGEREQEKRWRRQNVRSAKPLLCLQLQKSKQEYHLLHNRCLPCNTSNNMALISRYPGCFFHFVSTLRLFLHWI